jgi:ketosteroid isomerase-like protein
MPMKPLILAIAAALLAGPALAQDPWVAHKPEVAAVDAAVRAPLEAYLRGHATGDAAQFRQAFHDDAEIWGLRGDTVIQWTDDEYIGRAGNGQPPADEAQRRRWIEAVDVTGDTGVAKIVLDYPAVKFTDYMQLMRVDGRWVIINKMFLAEPKAAPAS